MKRLGIPSSSRFWATRVPSFKVNLRLNPSQSKATTNGGSSRNTTTTVCELAKFQRNHILTKKALRSICTRKPLQNVHRCRSNERLGQGHHQTSSQHSSDVILNGLRGPPVVGTPNATHEGLLWNGPHRLRPAFGILLTSTINTTATTASFFEEPGQA
jgi:hypothetical protein